jgi:hypothetical protein
MTRRSPLRLLSGVALLVLLSSSAGCGTGVAPASDAAAASAATAGRSPDTPADKTDGGSHGNPGAPGADPADGGGGGAAHGNPGAPGDVAVFEEGGDAPYSALVDDAATKCAHGVCTLLDPKILDGHVDRVAGGVGDCTIANKTDILYDPPARGGLFPHGATVQAQVHCADVETPVDEPAGGSPAGDALVGQEPANPGTGSAAGETTSGTTDQPQG